MIEETEIEMEQYYYCDYYKRWFFRPFFKADPEGEVLP